MVIAKVPRAERKKVRELLGPLKKKRLVAPQTRTLYDAAFDLFEAWMQSENPNLPEDERSCRCWSILPKC